MRQQLLSKQVPLRTRDIVKKYVREKNEYMPSIDFRRIKAVRILSFSGLPQDFKNMKTFDSELIMKWYYPRDGLLPYCCASL